MKTFLISNPMRNGVSRLDYVWDSYISQTYPLSNIGIFYLINNTSDNTVQILENYKKLYCTFKELSYTEIVVPEMGRETIKATTRHHKIHPYLVPMFNQCLEYGLKKEYDFVSVFGSDIKIDRNLVEKFVKYDVDCIAPKVEISVFRKTSYNLWSRERKGGARRSVGPNWSGLKELGSNLYISGLVLKREVIESGIRFEYDPNHFDEWEFSIIDKIRDKGFKVFMDSSIEAHNMRTMQCGQQPRFQVGL